MKTKRVSVLFFLVFTVSSVWAQPFFAHNLEKRGSNGSVEAMLQPNKHLSIWEHILLYSVNGLLLFFSIILISMLLRRKKPGKILVFFLLTLAIGYMIILRYGSMSDLLG
ncbi:hypothetical protein ACQYAD_18190 [Neobacillus sp. SM06]|uniref:hypothetical protein n=1 Tax=Neobacillus sp. SM06 TaxID=3422492 RepID=UPI003D2BB7E9